MTTMHIVYIMAIYFFVLLFFGSRAYRSCSIIIFISCCLNIVTSETIDPLLSDQIKRSLYIKGLHISILWDSFIATILIISKLFNQASGKQALVLCFAILINVIMVYDMTVKSSTITNLIYNHYVILITMVGLLQMAVSFNGFWSALSRMQRDVCRCFSGIRNYCGGRIQMEEPK